MERTFVMVKPDGVQRGLIGEIFSRLERRGLRLVAAKFMQVGTELAKAHYAEHEGKPFYDGLISYITSGPVLAMVWEGPRVIAVVRQTMGSTKPYEAAPGSVRHDFAVEVGRNVTHASADDGGVWWTGRARWTAGSLSKKRRRFRLLKTQEHFPLAP
jgi:nucleoside-diphosphate kinase